MNPLLPLQALDPGQVTVAGGKACKLAQLYREGFSVPQGLCITVDAFDAYMAATGLASRIGLEMERLPVDEMRWEEIWDLSQRIRNLFLNTPLPDELQRQLAERLAVTFGDRPTAVRSSSPQEDRTEHSFAGLHDSYVNVCGVEAILDKVRRVWASLWSDGAILYRRELDSGEAACSMAVLVQELIDGDSSGVAFSSDPDLAETTVVEAVHGLNEGMVDGSVPPDRWVLDRLTGRLRGHTAPAREWACRATAKGTELVALAPELCTQPPLTSEQLTLIRETAWRLETLFDGPQDIEWTFRGGTLYLLQTRPITTLLHGQSAASAWDADDKRPWYLSLKRSFSNLMELHQRIEGELLPDMAAQAQQLARTDLGSLSDAELIEECRERIRVHDHWVDVYWRDLIPFAHGARLFGQVYNDAVQPHDPCEYITLLTGTALKSMDRNRELQELAELIRGDASLREKLIKEPVVAIKGPFGQKLDAFVQLYQSATYQAQEIFSDANELVRLLLEMADRAPQTLAGHDVDAMVRTFLDRFPPDRHAFACAILEIGRASYRLRDDDNLILAGIESQLIRGVQEGRRRLVTRHRSVPESATADEVIRLMENPDSQYVPRKSQKQLDEPVEHQAQPHLQVTTLVTRQHGVELSARQLIGQPAGSGLALGNARVIMSPADLFAFQADEILVCDAIDPNMTFIVPLAAAIVERRGGMLVHGAIIAREYGLPCITGVPDVTALIQTGDRLTVDGYLGIVTRH